MIFPQSSEELLQLLDSPWFLLLVLWSMFWKGLALWQAAHNKQKIWFFFLFVLNTFGILEIIYLLFIAKSLVEIKLVSEKTKKQN